MEVYREVQGTKPWWILAIVVGVVAIAWWGFIQQIILGRQWGTNPAPDGVVWLITLLIGVGLPVFYVLVQLTITVDDTAVNINYRPLMSRQILITEIQGVTVREYNPIAEYGGWGVRHRGNKRAYSMKGKRGVELTLASGQQVMLGSEDADALAAAIQKRTG